MIVLRGSVNETYFTRKYFMQFATMNKQLYSRVSNLKQKPKLDCMLNNFQDDEQNNVYNDGMAERADA